MTLAELIFASFGTVGLVLWALPALRRLAAWEHDMPRDRVSEAWLRENGTPDRRNRT